MRSLREIRFRLSQEAANARMYFHAPSLPQATPRPARVKVLPPPEEYVARLCGSGFAHDVEQMAESI